VSSAAPSLFDRFADGERDAIVARLGRRHAVAGEVVVREGERQRELYVIVSGTAEVVAGGSGHVNVVGAGATIGEVSMLTAGAATATVRAVSDLDLLVVPEREFDELADSVPGLARNLGAIVSQRLARATRFEPGPAHGRISVLLDRGAPPLACAALACAVASATRARTVLLVPAASASPELSGLDLRWEGAAGLELAPGGPEGLAARALELARDHEHVLVQAPSLLRHLPQGTRTLELAPLGLPEPPRPLGPGLPSPRGAAAAYGRVARDLAGLRVGLALGSGSHRGYAHLGVLRALERLRIVPDFLAGTSIGASIAALYSLGYRPDEIGAVLDRAAPSIFQPVLSRRGLLSAAPLGNLMRGLAGETRIEDLPIPLAIVAADIAQGREIVFRTGVLWRAALASSAVPGVYPALRMGDHVLVDGGVLNPVPSSAVAEMGADVVIGVKLLRGLEGPPLEADSCRAGAAPPSLLRVLSRSVEVMQSKISTESAGAATILIDPRLSLSGLPGSKLHRFGDGRRYVEAGAAAVEEALPRLAEALPWVRPAGTALT